MEKEELAVTVVKTGFGTSLLRFVEWWIAVPATIVLVAGMRSHEFGFWPIYSVLVVLDFIWAVGTLLIQDGTETDITLMKTTGKLSEWLGRYPGLRPIFETGAVFWNTVWSGPAYVYTFLERYALVRSWKHTTLWTAALIQMGPWTLAYIAGYDGVLELFS